MLANDPSQVAMPGIVIFAFAFMFVIILLMPLSRLYANWRLNRRIKNPNNVRNLLFHVNKGQRRNPW